MLFLFASTLLLTSPFHHHPPSFPLLYAHNVHTKTNASTLLEIQTNTLLRSRPPGTYGQHLALVVGKEVFL